MNWAAVSSGTYTGAKMRSERTAALNNVSVESCLTGYSDILVSHMHEQGHCNCKCPWLYKLSLDDVSFRSVQSRLSCRTLEPRCLN